MNSIPDVFLVSRPNGNSKMACSVDEIYDFLLDYFVGFVLIMVNDLCLIILHHFIVNF